MLAAAAAASAVILLLVISTRHRNGDNAAANAVHANSTKQLSANFVQNKQQQP